MKTNQGKKILIKGNEALAEGAIAAGCRHYFAYPITPQNEIVEHLALRMPEVDGVFMQAESEVAAINMVYGAAAAGARAMTSSSSPGVSLKMEGISYLAGAELPSVIVNVQRGGPGLGSIQPSQADYFQATKGGGHGDYHCIVLAPGSAQEMADQAILAFELADKYRTPVMILSDGVLGQMMEPVVLPEAIDPKTIPAKPWALTGGKRGKARQVANSLFIDSSDLEAHNHRLQKKYAEIREKEVRFEGYNLEGAETLVVAYGIAARVARSAIENLGKDSRVGMLRPITLYPFPTEEIALLAQKVKNILVVELSAGQMIEDVRLAVEGKVPVSFYGRMGGIVPTPNEVTDALKKLRLQPALV
ncbi:MAG TPA: 3-methyl-2-oxobutanoate dehydrogenase subunit beta [Cyanobacteria bacterium UBA8530]|nr:3-methyl-2-oxobutanoate dehydrogenase subunit beta [Cyanobacteria bacterium UBA8530]